MKITRIRWVVVRNNRTEIFCCMNREHFFKPIDDISTAEIQTYCSPGRAKQAILRSNESNKDYEIVMVTETIEDIEKEHEAWGQKF